jgi:hypothetical protein
MLDGPELTSNTDIPISYIKHFSNRDFMMTQFVASHILSIFLTYIYIFKTISNVTDNI